MENSKTKPAESKTPKEIALHYMTTLVDVARESFLILSADLKVISANPMFYETFKVEPTETEKNYVYELGNGQWNIAELKSLFEEILPKQNVVRNYEVMHDFETIGRKTMLLNARQIDTVQLIILAIEDITVRKSLEEQLAEHTKSLETIVSDRTKELASRVKELEQMNKVMVGREMKMIELKAELDKLKKFR